MIVRWTYEIKSVEFKIILFIWVAWPNGPWIQDASVFCLHLFWFKVFSVQFIERIFTFFNSWLFWLWIFFVVSSTILPFSKSEVYFYKEVKIANSSQVKTKCVSFHWNEMNIFLLSFLFCVFYSQFTSITQSQHIWDLGSSEGDRFDAIGICLTLKYCKLRMFGLWHALNLISCRLPLVFMMRANVSEEKMSLNWNLMWFITFLSELTRFVKDRRCWLRQMLHQMEEH